MDSFLAFLQIIQILGKWTWTMLTNFHIVSGIILFWGLIARLGNNNASWDLGPWEIIAGCYLAIWYRRKKNRVSRSLMAMRKKSISPLRASKRLRPYRVCLPDSILHFHSEVREGVCSVLLP